jgi:hypothetical protein
MCKSYKAMRCMSTLVHDHSCDLVENDLLDAKVCPAATISSLAAAIPIAKGRSL